MAEWITNVMESLGYWGVALLMVLENIVPPIPSEIVLPAAGFAAGRGELSLWGVILAGSLGSLAGVTPWYLFARSISVERLFSWSDRYGKWLTVDRESLRQAMEWFDRWGGLAVLVCRMVPGVRTLISVPAGLAKMPLWQFIAYSAAGTFGWTVVLAWLGWLLADQYEMVDRYVGWITLAVFVGLGVWWLRRLVRRRGRTTTAK